MAKKDGEIKKLLTYKNEFYDLQTNFFRLTSNQVASIRLLHTFRCNTVVLDTCDISTRSISRSAFIHQSNKIRSLSFCPQSSEEEEEVKTEEKISESAILQEQLVGIINNILQEQDNFRARQVRASIKSKVDLLFPPSLINRVCPIT